MENDRKRKISRFRLKANRSENPSSLTSLSKPPSVESQFLQFSFR